jgi:hypothetical protein
LLRTMAMSALICLGPLGVETATAPLSAGRRNQVVRISGPARTRRRNTALCNMHDHLTNFHLFIRSWIGQPTLQPLETLRPFAVGLREPTSSMLVFSLLWVSSAFRRPLGASASGRGIRTARWCFGCRRLGVRVPRLSRAHMLATIAAVDDGL